MGWVGQFHGRSTENEYRLRRLASRRSGGLCFPRNTPLTKGLTMKLSNPLKSFASRLSMMRPGYRMRKRRSLSSRSWLAAEVLDERKLLSANVNLSVVAGVITMKSTDAGNPEVDVHRVDSSNVEFDPGFDTQITYKGNVYTSPFEVSIPKVAAVTVCLGTGYDSFDIYNL